MQNRIQLRAFDANIEACCHSVGMLLDNQASFNNFSQNSQNNNEQQQQQQYPNNL